MSMPKPKAKKPKEKARKKSKSRSDSPEPDDTLPHLTDYPDVDESPDVEVHPGKVTIDFNMIVRRNLAQSIQDASHEEIIDSLHSVTHLRLDRERITHIDNLEMLGSNVTNVYLQQNRIQQIDNLSCLPNLSFLTLSGNNITKVENLRHLDKLKFLDLSDNMIENLDVEELPKSLVILSLNGNPCTDHDDHRRSVIAALPNLKQLNGVTLSREVRRVAGHVVSPDSEGSEEDEEEESDTQDESQEENMDDRGDSSMTRSVDDYLRSTSVEHYGVFEDVVTGIRGRQKDRLAETDQQHQQRKLLLKQMRDDAKNARGQPT